MENNSLFLDQSIEQSSMNKEKEFFDQSNAVFVVGVPLVRLIKLIGFRKALSSKIVRWRYIVRLWILREIYIMKALLENYEKIPKGTPTFLIVSLFRLMSIEKGVLLRIEKSLLNKLIRNPYENKKMDNDDNNNPS